MELVSRRRSPPASLAGGGPARVPIRFPRYPVFKVPGACCPPRPAASFRPRRKEIYYAHPLPRSRGFLAFFPGRSASGVCFPHMTWGDALLLPFGPRTHSLHKPRKGGGRRECDPAFRGASPQGGSPPQGGLPTAGGLPPPYGDAPCYAMRPGDSRAPGLSNR